MTKIFNDPSEFAEEALAGFCDVHSHLVRQVPGGAVRRFRPATPKLPSWPAAAPVTTRPSPG